MADFNAEPYWDDFEATNGALENNYMRILFRPGYAVQARELTQIQSILQNQIKQFGDHIFQDGSPVIGGHLTLDTSINYVKLDKQYNNNDIDLEDFFGITVFNTGSPKTRAKVIQTYSTTNDRALLIKYLRGSSFTAGQTITTAGGAAATVSITTPTGVGSVVSINEGVFYVNGFFVTVAPQTIVLEPYSSTPTYRVGLQIDEEIVTESVDNALLDPAQESFNYQAPGAHRYQFNLVLAKRSIDSIDDRRFFELLRVENGVVTKQVSYPVYSELEKTLARRTYDESGNYAVKPFRVSISANTPATSTAANNSFIVNVEPGKAYVKGFEFETIGTSKVSAQRARNTKSNKDYDLSVYYGNRLQVANVFGSLNNGIIFSDNLDIVDIHCVANCNVSFSGETSQYYATRIGTAKLRNIDRTSTQNIFFSYLADVNFTPIISLAGSSSPNTSSINLGAHFSANTSAYVGGTVTLIDSVAAGQSAKILTYNGATKFATLDKDFTTTVVQNDRFSLSMPLGSAESIIVANTTSFTSANLQANVSVNSKDTLGNVSIEDASYTRLLFELPNYYIKRDSDASVDVYRRYIVKNQSFSSNGAATISLTGNETYDFGTNGQTLSSTDRNENIMVIPTTGSAAGQILDMTSGNRNVLRTTSQSITLYTDSASGASFTGDVYVTTKIVNANPSFRRVKSLVQSNSAIISDTIASAAPVSGYSDVRINASNGIAWFTTANVISKVAGEKQSLFVSDVIKIKKIYDSQSLATAPTASSLDITDRYIFNSGQTDGYYDHASISLKPGSQPPTGQTAVLFDYFTHTGTGYISAGSYPLNLYETEQIPIYKSSLGKIYNLRDCIDLRPIRLSGLSVNPYLTVNVDATVNVTSGGFLVTANISKPSFILTPPITTGTVIKIGNEYKTVNSVINLTAVTVTTAFNASATDSTINVVEDNYDFSSSIIPRPTDPLELDYEYYLPRIDKLIITKDKQFKMLTGVPSLAPQEPIENEDSMAIYKMYIPAYTATLQSIDLRFIDNRRYTMKDISELDKRITFVENYINLSESEKRIIEDPPKSPTTPTINKPIYGTIVDDFNDLSVVDTSNDFACSIENGALSCYKDVKSFQLIPASNLDAGIMIRDKFITLPYTEKTIVEQKLYTSGKSEPVQSTMIAKFEGFATLTPESDYFYSLEHQPFVTDTFGRYYEVRQQTPAENPAITDSLVDSIRGGGYADDYYNNAVIVGPNQPTQITPSVSAPHFLSNGSTADVPVTQPIALNFAGVAPETYLNSTWTGTPAIQPGAGMSEKPFSQSWYDDNSINLGGEFGRYD
jgi:hypothetical protein